MPPATEWTGHTTLWSIQIKVIRICLILESTRFVCLFCVVASVTILYRRHKSVSSELEKLYRIPKIDWQPRWAHEKNKTWPQNKNKMKEMD